MMILILPLIAGAVYVASPGPVLVSTVRWGVRGGMRGGMSVQLGAFVGDLPYVAVAVAGWHAVAMAVPRCQLGENIVLAVSAFFTGNLLCAALLSAGVSYVRRHTRPGFWTGMSWSCGLALIALGLVVAYSSV